MRLIALIALTGAACSKPAIAPALANKPSPSGPIESTKEPEGCQVVGADTLRVAGELARAEVIKCDLGEKPADENDPDNGLTVHAWEGYVKITRPGGRTLREQFADWTDGWEWGGGIGLEGPLVATTARNDAVLVEYYDSNVDMSSQLLSAYAVQGEKLVSVGTWSKEEMSITFSKAHDVARVQTCVFGDPAVKHAGCGDRDDADPGPTFELRWTGTKIDEKTLK